VIDRRLLLGAAILAIAIALIAARPHPTPGPALRDFEAYYSGAATFNEGRDPYSRDVWRFERHIPEVDASRDEVLPFVGPPYTLAFFSFFSRMPYLDAVRVWSGVLAAALIAAVLLTLRLARVPFGVGTFIAGAGLAVGFAPITSDLALGQVALLAYAGALFAIVSIDWRFVFPVAGAIVALAQPNVALALTVLLSTRRGVMTLVVAGVAAVAGLFATGQSLAFEYPRALLAHQTAELYLAIQQTPAAVAYGFGATPVIARTIGFIVAALALTFAVVSIVTKQRPLAQRFAIACAILPLISTFFHEHDLLVTFAPAVWCARYARGRTRDLALFATMLVAIDWLGLAQRPDGIAQSALLAFAALCCFTTLGPESRIPTAGATAAAACFAIGAIIAVGHPAPIWPDALGAFHADPNASIADVWQQEQARSGLLTTNPWWASLRAFALFGSALLAFATARSSEA
jgi:hypothetical protein